MKTTFTWQFCVFFVTFLTFGMVFFVTPNSKVGGWRLLDLQKNGDTRSLRLESWIYTMEMDIGDR